MRRKRRILSRYAVHSSMIFVFLGFAAIFLFRSYIAQMIWTDLRAFRTAILFTRDPSFAYALGDYHFNASRDGVYDLNKALLAYKRAVAMDDALPWGHYQIARVYFVRGEIDSALTAIQKELEIRPYNLRALYMRGLIYGHLGESAKAADDFRRFVAWAPTEWAGYNDLAWILSKEGNYHEAREVIQAAFAKAYQAETNPWLWNSLGVADLNSAKYAEARASFQKALELAIKLTPAEWRSAYPGNSPSSAEAGLLEFIDMIRANMRRAI